MLKTTIFPLCALFLLAGTAPADEARTFHFKYSATLPEVGADSWIELWLPLPLESPHQRIQGLHVHAPVEYAVETESKHGNRMLKVAGTGNDLSGQTVQFHFQATRAPVTDTYDPGGETGPYTGPNQLVPIDGIIAERARKSAGDARDPLEVARALYDDVVTNLDYDKSGEGWGRGDAVHACNVQKGNCTDFHSLFIAMCRAQGIPARFTIGFPLPPDETSAFIPGYHCWAEFRVEGKGWVPVDASEARKHADRKEALFGGLDANRIEFTRGRDLTLPGRDDLEPLNYFIDPYLLVDGVPADGVKRELHFQDAVPGRRPSH